MGHILAGNCSEPDPAKIEAIIEMPKPKSVVGAQFLNGFVTYLLKIMPKLSDVVVPIGPPTWKDTEYYWSIDRGRAFEQVKEMAIKATVL